MAMNLIAHAIENEKGTGTGGTAGDQVGWEICAMTWYRYPGAGWLAVYRSRSADKAEAMARFMEEAICNGYIGYNQSRWQRKRLFDHMLSIGFNISEVSEPYSTDCGGLVYLAVYSAYRVPATRADFDGSGTRQAFGVPTVSRFDDYLMRDVRDFDKLESDEYCESPDLLLRGDILIAGDHIAIWI